jgi:hypothetical protein
VDEPVFTVWLFRLTFQWITFESWLASKAAKEMKIKEKELAMAAEKDKEVKAEDDKDEKKDQEEKHEHEKEQEQELEKEHGTGGTPALIDVITKQRTETRNVVKA